MSNCCCCSLLTISGGLGYMFYYFDVKNLLDDLDKFLVDSPPKKNMELTPLKKLDPIPEDTHIVSQPYQNEYIFL